MSYQSERRTRLQTQLTNVQTALTNLWETYTELTTKMNKAYSFNSGDGGEQRTTRRDLSEIQKEIRELEATEAHLINELSCMGLVTSRLRRKA